jgi:hypothetical protein
VHQFFDAIPPCGIEGDPPVQIEAVELDAEQPRAFDVGRGTCQVVAQGLTDAGQSAAHVIVRSMLETELPLHSSGDRDEPVLRLLYP